VTKGKAARRLHAHLRTAFQTPYPGAKRKTGVVLRNVTHLWREWEIRLVRAGGVFVDKELPEPTVLAWFQADTPITGITLRRQGPWLQSISGEIAPLFFNLQQEAVSFEVETSDGHKFTRRLRKPALFIRLFSR
jgi:hypothetical protein